MSRAAQETPVSSKDDPATRFACAEESEVWIAENRDHMIHFNGERFLGPYPDVMPTQQ